MRASAISFLWLFLLPAALGIALPVAALTEEIRSAHVNKEVPRDAGFVCDNAPSIVAGRYKES